MHVQHTEVQIRVNEEVNIISIPIEDITEFLKTHFKNNRDGTWFNSIKETAGLTLFEGELLTTAKVKTENKCINLCLNNNRNNSCNS